MGSSFRNLKDFGILISIQFFEKLAYTNLILQLPIFIAQKDIAKGLGWSQETKGLIYFFWALIQNTVPIFAGYISDQYRKKTIVALGIALVSLGYSFFFIQKSILSFILATILIGIGSGCFKPAIQGSLAATISKNKINFGWGAYVVIVNISAFTAGILSKQLREINWDFVFLGSIVLSLITLVLILLLYPNEKYSIPADNTNVKLNFKELFDELKSRKVLILLGIASSFTLIYMQFYESLPNFIYDWSDTSGVSRSFALPSFMLMHTYKANQISYEWIYNLNSALIILFTIWLTILLKKTDNINALSIGLMLVILGFFFCGFTRNGSILILGVVIYTFGEMIMNTFLLETFSKIAPNHKKSTYLGILNLSYAFGLSIGALSGGFLYKHFAEKQTLAQKFLIENGLSNNNVNPITSISEKFNFSPEQVTTFLWTEFVPYLFWTPFIVIGFIGLLLCWLVKKYKLI